MHTLSWLKIGLVLFWSTWSTLVLASNLGDAAVSMGMVGTSFPFASGNLDAVRQVTAPFGLSGLAGVLFTGVVIWDAINAALLWRAAGAWKRIGRGDYVLVDVAFAVALGQWCALMVADELFLAFKVAPFEATHRSIFMAMLVTLVAIHLLPGPPGGATRRAGTDSP